MLSLHNNINALNSNSTLKKSNASLQSSLERLSSGHRINSAADDASGMTIADSLRSQASALTQSIRNANDAIGIIQIADSAMQEQVDIVDDIRRKAIQSAQDTQTNASRKALHADIVRLLEQLDNIANNTSYNGRSLLSGSFTNKKFQIGAYSNETVNASIGGTNSNQIGQTRFITGKTITEDTTVAMRFKNVDGFSDVDIESVVISTSAGTGLGSLAEVINRASDKLDLRATYSVVLTGDNPVGPSKNGGAQGGAVEIKDLVVNGINLGNFNDIKDGDSDSKIVAAINYYTPETGIQASVDSRGHLQFTSTDGRGINVSAQSGFEYLGLGDGKTSANGGKEVEFYGRLTLIRNDARDILVEEQIGTTDSYTEGAASIGLASDSRASQIINLRSVRGGYTIEQACAMGAFSNSSVGSFPTGDGPNGDFVMGAGVTTYRGAQAVIDIADTSLKMLEKVRSDLGSTQIQLEAIVRNISSTKTNIQASESQIRDTDYGEEIQNFSQKNALISAGNYALVQSNNTLQSIQSLLQL